MAFSNVHYVSIYQTVTSLTYVFVLLAFRPQGAEAIGEIDGFQVFYNSRGFYFYWNEETKFLLESWLTYPSYPYGWLS
ncbi:hypothetical protein GRJ39_004819 [Salmonella enterica]|nr:hypothetical protein [Salmonella enterica]EEH0770836.1 hypothetical protein [Salmonella enterica]